MEFSVIVPAYNAETTLSTLLDSLFNQTHKDFEIIVIDDDSKDETHKIAQSYHCTLIKLSDNHGPAYCRNLGAQNARGDILVFIDSDCRADHMWLEKIGKHFSQNDAEAIMGKLTLLPSSFLGNSISALGFPAGGAIGFHRIWKVDKEGYTDSLSSCNCAIKKDIFWDVGGFDESFPYPGGEDSLLAYSIRESKYRIKYCPDVLVYHQARDSLNDFFRWHFRRGISSYIFSKKISRKKDFLVLRIWSTKNIIKNYFFDRRFLLILFLLGASFIMQLIGFLFAKQNKGFYERFNH